MWLQVQGERVIRGFLPSADPPEAERFGYFVAGVSTAGVICDLHGRTPII
jgi:hypothetical protein